ncbi:MAG: hypothetical protein KDB03_02970 [Planctomycetales bacterium]|nr:hypothetical protein [Planctomycetales bacterium]
MNFTKSLNLVICIWPNSGFPSLDAAYEATVLASLLNTARTGNNRLYLTLLSGGAFGNQESWTSELFVDPSRSFKP